MADAETTPRPRKKRDPSNSEGNLTVILGVTRTDARRPASREIARLEEAETKKRASRDAANSVSSRRRHFTAV